MRRLRKCLRPEGGRDNLAQGCRAAATLGMRAALVFNPIGVARASARRNPLGVLDLSPSDTQGSRWAATLGYAMSPLRGRADLRPLSSRARDNGLTTAEMSSPRRGRHNLAQGCRAAATLGMRAALVLNPIGVARASVRRNPVGVLDLSPSDTQGSRCAATLGYAMSPLRGRADLRPLSSRARDNGLTTAEMSLPRRGRHNLAQGCRAAATLGMRATLVFNPIGVARASARRNPVGVLDLSPSDTQGSRWAATLGYAMSPLRGRAAPWRRISLYFGHGRRSSENTPPSRAAQPTARQSPSAR